MPSPTSHTATFPLTNGRSPPITANITTAHDLSAHSDSDASEGRQTIVDQISSDEDAQGESDDDEDMEDKASDSSDDMDAEGEPDGDYDSETPPPVRVDDGRIRSSTSQESKRPSKRKASVEEDEFITQNPELYGLRRSVSVFRLISLSADRPIGPR